MIFSLEVVVDEKTKAVHYTRDLNGYHPTPPQCLGYTDHPYQLYETIASRYMAHIDWLKEQERKRKESLTKHNNKK